MDNVVPFRRQPAGGGTLCRNGHHKWAVWKAKQFDTREGRLVTVYRCERCKAEKVMAH